MKQFYKLCVFRNTYPPLIKTPVFNREWVYTNFRSFSRFLGQRLDSEIILEKPRISRIFKAFSSVVSGAKIKPKSWENDRKWVYSFFMCLMPVLCLSLPFSKEELAQIIQDADTSIKTQIEVMYVLPQYINLEKLFPNATILPHVVSVDTNLDHKTFKATCVYDEHHIILKGKIVHYAHIPTLNKMIKKGDRIQEEDLVWRKIVEQNINTQTVRTNEHLVGKVARYDLDPYRPIRASHVHRPLLVQQNQSVVLTLKTQHVFAKTYGKALENGSKGDIIRVTNPTSKRFLVGRVHDIGHVIIEKDIF